MDPFFLRVNQRKWFVVPLRPDGTRSAATDWTRYPIEGPIPPTGPPIRAGYSGWRAGAARPKWFVRFDARGPREELSESKQTFENGGTRLELFDFGLAVCGVVGFRRRVPPDDSGLGGVLLAARPSRRGNGRSSRILLAPPSSLHHIPLWEAPDEGWATAVDLDHAGAWVSTLVRDAIGREERRNRVRCAPGTRYPISHHNGILEVLAT